MSTQIDWPARICAQCGLVDMNHEPVTKRCIDSAPGLSKPIAGHGWVFTQWRIVSSLPVTPRYIQLAEVWLAANEGISRPSLNITTVKVNCTCNTRDLMAYGCPSARGNACRSAPKISYPKIEMGAWK